MDGRKFDAGKPRMSLMPEGFVFGVLRVLEVGAKKYAIDNWKVVPDARRRYYDAAHRHIEAFWNGERYDVGTDDQPGTGEHHLLCAACSIAFMWWLDTNQDAKVVDDA